MRLLAIFLVLICANASALESHCSKQEQVVFSCAIVKSSKVASLCASKTLSEERGALAYRFGPIGKPEFEFPSSSEKSAQQFHYAHYFRFQTDRTEVSFSNGNFLYFIFDYYDGEAKPKQSRGVRVSPKGKTSHETELLCREPVESQLHKLEGVVPCDSGNALASCI